MEPTFEVHKHTVWIDDGALQFVEEYIARQDAGCIVWTAFPAFGQKLARRTGLEFFHAGGLSASGKSIETYVPGVDGPRAVIASINANATGRNLQNRWFRNLVVGCPAKADLLQQLIGRTHRRGQAAETVYVDVLFSSIENVLSLYKARERATVDRTLGRALESRLLDCDWQVRPLIEHVDVSSPVWSARRAFVTSSEETLDD
jgi:hypothetical protein